MSTVKWDSIITDPLYLGLPADEKMAIQRDYLHTQQQKALAKSKTSPAAPTSGAASLGPRQPRRIDYASIPTPMRDVVAGEIKKGFQENLTGALAGALERNVKASAPADTSLAGLAAAKQARRIDPTATAQPKPSASALLKAIASNTADNIEGARQNLSTGTAGLGEGLAAGGSYLAGNLLDPAALAVDAVTLGVGGKALKRAAPLIQRVVPAVASGAIQGGAYGLATGDTESALAQALIGGAVNGAMGARLGGAKPAASVPLAEPRPVRSIAAKAAGVPAHPMVQRLIAEEVGSFDPAALGRSIKQLRNATQRRADEAAATGNMATAAAEGANASALNDVRTMLNERPAETVDPSGIAASRHLNFGKLNIGADEANNLATLVQQVASERGYDHKQRVGFDEIRAEAAQIDPALLDDLKLPKHGETMNPVVRYAARERLNAINKEIVGAQKDLNDNLVHWTADEQKVAENRIATLERDAKGLLDVLIPTRSQDGRNLAYHRMMAENSWDADYWLSRANRVSGGALTPDAHNRIRQIIVEGNAADAAGDQVRIKQARIDLSRELMKLEKTGTVDTLLALRKAGLLTGVKTIQRNLGGTAAYQALEGVAKVPASIIDMALSLSTGNRTVLIPSPKKIAGGYKAAATKGRREFGEVMRMGNTADALGSLEYSKEVSPDIPLLRGRVAGRSGNEILGAYINGVFRFQSAQDRLTKAYAFQRSIQDQARLKVINDGTPHANRAAMIADLERNPTPDMLAEAIADADFMTFTNDTDIANAIQRGKKALSPGKRAFMDMVLPFVKTPAAVGERVIEYAVGGAPRGMAHLVQATVRRSLTPAQQRTIALGLGRGMVGQSLIYMGYLLAEKGMMTGTFDPETKEIDQAANRTPSSIKLGGQWVNIQAFSPIGNLLTLGATIQRGVRDAGDAATLGLKTVLDQPFLQGANQLVDLARDTERSAPKFAASMAGSWVPTIAGETAQALDTKDRAVSKEMPEAAYDTIQKKIPGLRDDLPAKLTPLGDEITVPNGLNAFNAMSGRPAVEDTDPVVAEMVHLSRLPGGDPGFRMKPAPKVLRFKGYELAINEDQQREFMREVGKLARARLTPIISDPAYQRIDDPIERIAILDDVYSESFKRVSRQMMGENRDQLTRATKRK